MNRREFSILLEAILSEDLGCGDVTTAFTPNRKVRAEIIADSDGFVCGLKELRTLFSHHGVSVRKSAKDGVRVKRGQTVMSLTGMSAKLLPIERTALNLLSRMSAVATLTREYADLLKRCKSKAKIVATRKTTPLLRYFEKRAVVVGGGLPHRMGLYDMVLIKDNHLMLFGGDVKAALEAAKKSRPPGIKIEIEVQSAEDALIAAENGADLIMFDNMRPAEISAAIEVMNIRRVRRRLILEVSGGISLSNLPDYACLGVDWISTGRLTHSAPNVDFRMEIL